MRAREIFFYLSAAVLGLLVAHLLGGINSGHDVPIATPTAPITMPVVLIGFGGQQTFTPTGPR